MTDSTDCDTISCGESSPKLSALMRLGTAVETWSLVMDSAGSSILKFTLSKVQHLVVVAVVSLHLSVCSLRSTHSENFPDVGWDFAASGHSFVFEIDYHHKIVSDHLRYWIKKLIDCIEFGNKVSCGVNIVIESTGLNTCYIAQKPDGRL